MTLADPARIDVRGALVCGRDVSIDVNCVFEGEVELGDGVSIGANCVLQQRAGRRRHAHRAVLPHRRRRHRRATAASAPTRGCARAPRWPTTCTSATSSRSRTSQHRRRLQGQPPRLRRRRRRSARDVNIGAGTITCNYDGANKHRTVIEDDVFIGSDTQLVAPVTVGRGATLGAGTTLTRDAPPDAAHRLAREAGHRSPGWKRPVKAESKELIAMCGIVGAVAERNIVPVLLEGLKRLEYRGYDSAGLAV